MGTNSTSLHTRSYQQRVHKALADEREHEVDRVTRRLIRSAIAKVIHHRSTELGPAGCACHLTPGRRCRHVEALWAGYARRFSSCDYAKVFRNALTGTEIGVPFSCRVPGCPHCESERVDELRRRFVPLVEAARRPRVAYLTMPNVPAGGLGAGWAALGAAFLKLWRSPLFAAVERCTTPKARARRHRPGETCVGHQRRCRPGKVGCLAAIDGEALEVRRECAGRCRRRPREEWHPECRPCPGHQPATAALLSLETTVNRRASTWHPHANLLYAGDYIAKADLQAAWSRALVVPMAIVHIRDAAKAPPGYRGEWSIKKALYETVKYAIKPDAQLLDPAAPRWFVEWVEARRGRRLVRSYGDWHGVADVDDEDAGPREETVAIADDEGFRQYRLPVLDPITDVECGEFWVMQPGDGPRSRFMRVQPPTSDDAPRRAWLVWRANFDRLRGDPDG